LRVPWLDSYLKGFRVEQCSLFLQHKCTQHRPYTCFYWHFKNQRRRRPLRKRDGQFNYNPDTYCDKYDEQSGVCPNSDDCPFVHRNAGDTEKRYHLRYYKTATCIHETDAKGNCTKNGVHCAFAHGAADMRPPVYDIRDLQQQQSSSLSVSLASSSSSSNSQQQANINQSICNQLSGHTNILTNDQQNSPKNSDMINEKTLNLSTSLEKERMLNEDPKWNDTGYVLTNYKTEQCRRPPRLCRQGFACPQYHNARDKRRNPNLFKYRSTPCPNVKQGDDWLEPTVCDNGDLCKYCHSRTEQQFHPEIYKSSKCNDMISTGYCPRGPFCAFAHIEQELKNQRAHSNSESPNSDYTLENFISNALPSKDTEQDGVVNEGHATFGANHHTDEYSTYAEVSQSNDNLTNESTSSTTSLNSHSTLLIQNGTAGKTSNLSMTAQAAANSNNNNNAVAAVLMQQVLAATAANSYTCKPIGSEREKPKSQMGIQQQIQQSQHIQLSGGSKQGITESDNSSSNQVNQSNNSSNQQSNSSNSTNSSSNNPNLMNEIDTNNTNTIEKLRHDLFRQAEVSNKLETLCLQYRQWVEKLTIDVNEWKAKYARCDSEKKNLELQLFNKLSLEQSIAPLRNASFNLNGNSNDLIDGNDLTKLLSFNNTNNLIQNNNLNTNTNNISSINKK